MNPRANASDLGLYQIFSVPLISKRGDAQTRADTHLSGFKNLLKRSVRLDFDSDVWAEYVD
jgi:hypothetical protein